jgi:hypothetical protein
MQRWKLRAQTRLRRIAFEQRVFFSARENGAKSLHPS